MAAPRKRGRPRKSAAPPNDDRGEKTPETAAGTPSVAQAAQDIAKGVDASLSEASPAEKPKRKHRRTRKKAPEPDPRVEQLAGMLSPAIHATAAPLVQHYDLLPAFSEEQAKALGEAWSAVAIYYTKESDNPWPGAILATATAFAPYAFQLAARSRAKSERRKAIGEGRAET